MTSTTTLTTTQVKPLSALERRLQLATDCAPAPALRLRAPAAPAAPTHAPQPEHAVLARRFSFVWPFISKEHSAATGPFLRSRCTQLLRQFPAFLSGRTDHSAHSSVRDTISRVLSQLKRVWLVLAVYLAVVVLAGLSTAVALAFWFAVKPPGFWFLGGCVCATGAIAGVCFSTRERPPLTASSALPVTRLLPFPVRATLPSPCA